MVDSIIFADELMVEDLKFISKQWYASAGNRNGLIGYHMIDEDSFTIPRFARGVLFFLTFIIGGMERVRSIAGISDAGARKGAGSERNQTVLANMKNICRRYL